MQQQLQQQITNFIKPFIEMSNLAGSQFPLLTNTYSLWRKVCYKNLMQKYSTNFSSQELKLLKKAFLNVSQRKLLPDFIQKVQEEIDGRGVGWKKAMLRESQLKVMQKEQEYQQLLLEYCESLYQLQLHIEMFYDLISIPYTEIYEQHKTYMTSKRFSQLSYAKKDETLVDKACNKIGKNIISKGLGKISETFLSNRFLYGMTGILGSFNPIAFAASFSISYAMESHEQYSKAQQLTSELQFLKEEIEKNLVELKQCYDLCLGSIEAMSLLSEEGDEDDLQREKRRFKSLISNVLEEDFLQIKVTRQGSWELVQLRNKKDVEEFYELNSDEHKKNEDNVQGMTQMKEIKSKKWWD